MAPIYNVYFLATTKVLHGMIVLCLDFFGACYDSTID